MITSILSEMSQSIDARVVVSNGPPAARVTRGEIRPHAAGPQPRHKGRDPASRRRPTATSQRTRATSLQQVKHAALRTQKDCIRTAKEPKQSKTKRNKVKQNNSKNKTKIKYPQLCAYKYGNSEMVLSVGFIKMPALFTLGLE